MHGFALILVAFAAMARAAPLPQTEDYNLDWQALADLFSNNEYGLGDYAADDTVDLGDYAIDNSAGLGDYTSDGTLTGDLTTDAMDYVQDLGQGIRQQEGDYYTYDPNSDLPDMTTWTQAERTGYLTNRVDTTHNMNMDILNNWSSGTSSVFI